MNNTTMGKAAIIEAFDPVLTLGNTYKGISITTPGKCTPHDKMIWEVKIFHSESGRAIFRARYTAEDLKTIQMHASALIEKYSKQA